MPRIAPNTTRCPRPRRRVASESAKQLASFSKRTSRWSVRERSAFSGRSLKTVAKALRSSPVAGVDGAGVAEAHVRAPAQLALRIGDERREGAHRRLVLAGGRGHAMAQQLGAVAVEGGDLRLGAAEVECRCGSSAGPQKAWSQGMERRVALLMSPTML